MTQFIDWTKLDHSRSERMGCRCQTSKFHWSRAANRNTQANNARRTTDRWHVPPIWLPEKFDSGATKMPSFDRRDGVIYTDWASLFCRTTFRQLNECYLFVRGVIFRKFLGTLSWTRHASDSAVRNNSRAKGGAHRIAVKKYSLGIFSRNFG